MVTVDRLENGLYRVEDRNTGWHALYEVVPGEPPKHRGGPATDREDYRKMVLYTHSQMKEPQCPKQ